MREFYSFRAFADFLSGLLAREEEAAKSGLEAGIAIAHAESQSELGHYQNGIGPFEDWGPLAFRTVRDRKRLGFTLNDPLLRSGTLRDAIESHVDIGAREAAIGVPSRMVQDASRPGREVDIGLIAEVQEEGNERVPPRSFLGGAMCRRADEIVDATVKPLIRLLEGEEDLTE